jgi:GTP-binding protein Era
MALRSGFVCILGRPNAGKSTLLNALAGEKLAIVSPKPQTTRNRLLGILNLPKIKGRPAAQVVLIDTPGVHKADTALGRQMMREVREALRGCDLIFLIADASEKTNPGERFVLQLLDAAGTPAFLLLNKIDRIDKQHLLPLIEHYRQQHAFREIMPISALKKQGLDELLNATVAALREGPRYFPEDQVTDQPLRFMVAEAIREQVLLATKEEVPHATSVLIEQFEEGKKLTRVAAVIFCERDGQKAILVGRGGQMLKKIGTAARLEIETLVHKRVFLALFVKVKARWRDSDSFVEGLDWRLQLEQMAGPPRE